MDLSVEEKAGQVVRLESVMNFTGNESLQRQNDEA